MAVRAFGIALSIAVGIGATAVADAAVGADPGTVAGETGYPVPSTGAYSVTGRGWGHGLGMSQHGAQGAALTGATGTAILNFYYPTTVTARIPSGPIRVLLVEFGGPAVTVTGGRGLAVRDGATGRVYPLGAAPFWRVALTGTRYRVQRYLDARRGWANTALAGHPDFAGPLRFQGSVALRAVLPAGGSWLLDGTLTAVRTTPPTAAGGQLAVINTVPMEAYVAAVTVRESPASWRPAALQAQAVAARTYAAYRRRGAAAAGASSDLCDTTSCQVYRGRAQYNKAGTLVGGLPGSVTAAAAATAGQIRTYRGRPIYAAYSSSNGGWTVADTKVGYLPARPDPYDALDGNHMHRWTATLPATALERCFPALGALTRLVVTARDGNGEWGGRLQTLRLEGARAGVATRVAITGVQLRFCAKLRSTWLTFN